MTAPSSPTPATTVPDDEAVAVIGMAGRFPGADDVEAFWRNVQAGVQSISRLDPERLDDAFSDATRAAPAFVAARPILADTDLFDAEFFGMHAREAALTDPQHRVFMECAWTALESAGYDPSRTPLAIGVVAGCSLNTYFLHHICTDRQTIERFTSDFQLGGYPTLLGAGQDFLSTRIAYKLDLRGPAMTLGTACSTSLVAVAQACQQLRLGQADMMLAGGVSISYPQHRGYSHVAGGMGSADGACRPFDAAASGTVFGSGAAVVLLKRLSDAVAARDTIHAVIRAASTNNDGARKIGFTAPSVEGQVDVIRDAHRRAGVEARQIGYVECHGTATPLGDPIEFEALRRAFRASTGERGFCALGSAKGNVGHLDAAAGVTGLIKAICAVRDGVLPPMAGFTAPNPLLDLGTSPFRIDSAARPWPDEGMPRRAGVSALGVGGTNVHVVIEAPPPPPALDAGTDAMEETARPMLLPVSARSPAALEAAMAALARHLDEAPSAGLDDIAFTLRHGRRGFDHRAAVVGRSPPELAAALRRRPIDPASARDLPVPVVFMFPGQGAQHAGMAGGLYASEPVFRAIVDAGAEILHPLLGADLRGVLGYRGGPEPRAADRLRATRFAQPALFLVEYGLARLWMDWGVAPAAMVGHSVGEVVCAALAGVIGFEDALAFVAERGRLMGDMPPGRMMAVRLAETDLLATLPPGLALAAVNAPRSCVVSGPGEAMDAFAADLTARNVAHRALQTSHAFHSPMMDPVLEPLVEHLSGVSLGLPTIPYVSGVTGQWVEDAELSADYWARHCRSCIRFGDAVSCAVGDDRPVLLEVGPGRTLGALSAQVLDRAAVRRSLASLPDTSEPRDDAAALMTAAGALWTLGGTLRWDRLESRRGRRIPLPTYPFERKRHWVEAPAPRRTPAEAAVPPIPDLPGDQPMSPPAAPIPPSAPGAHRDIEERLFAILRDLSGEPIGEDHRDTGFLDLGFDSLFLAQFVGSIDTAFGVTVTFRQMLDNLSSVAALAAHVAARQPARAPAPPSPAAPVAPTDAPVRIEAPVPPFHDADRASALQGVMAQQLATLQALVSQQLQILGGPAAMPAGAALPASPPAFSPASPPAPAPAVAPAEAPASGRLQVYGTARPSAPSAITPAQRAFIDDLAARYGARTPGSKRAAQAHRAVLADPRAAAGFRREWKEIVYPVLCVRSRGSRIFDVDGNGYVDLVNGYGQTFFGHAPGMVTDAVSEQLGEGFAIGPQSALAGDVAARVSRLTGNQRVTFCNTGSEAVMAAMRVARSVTGRKTVVVFEGSYHGQFDEVLVKAAPRQAPPGAKPAASGIPGASVANMVVLPYGTDESAAWIRDHAGELAAVVLEPVQSRHPAFLPGDFIAEMRRITSGSGTALVFDEVVTGFRVHPGGMQAVLGIRADMATYGKVVGGGLPIGILAGTGRFMDALDGGQWRFGDESFPEVAPTFFAGTFVRHPLALAAARAVLTRVEAEGPALQRDLAARTAAFVARFNADLARRGIESRAETFSSWFYFNPSPEDRLASLFFHHARLLGVHIQDGFPCFLTTEHSEEDLQLVFDAFSQSLDALAAVGILAGTRAGTASAAPTSDPAPLPSAVPWTEPQREIWLTAQLGDGASCAFNESLSLTLTGDLDLDALRAALGKVVDRHDSLRARHDPDNEAMAVEQPEAFAPTPVDLCGSPDPDAALRALLDGDARTPFDLVAGPLFRATLAAMPGRRHVLVLTAHHIVCDGWSFNVIANEILALYRALSEGTPAGLPAAPSFRRYALDQAEPHAMRTVSEAYWLDQFATPPAELELPTDRPRPARKSFRGATYHDLIDLADAKALKAAGAKQGCTTFATLLTALQVVIGRLSGESDIVVAIPTAGQSLCGIPGLVGHCVNLLPLRVRLDWDAPVMRQARETKARLLDAFEHQDFTYGTLVRKLGHQRDPGRLPLTQIQFNLEKLAGGPELPGLAIASAPNGKAFSNFDLFFNFIEGADGLRLDCDYNTDLFDAATIRRWVGHLRSVIGAMIAEPATPVADVPLMDAAACRALLDRPNETAAADIDLQPVHRLVARQAALAPDAVAVAWRDETLSFAELDARANRLARHIAEMAPPPAGRVAVATSRSPDLIVAILAILKAGHAYVPLDLRQPPARQQAILEDARVAAIVTDDPSLSADTHGLPVIDLSAEAAAIAALSAEEPSAPPEQDIDSPAYVVFTSGSTGRPKGVEVTHRSLANLLWSMARRPGLTARDRLLAVTTLAFDIAAAELLLPLIVGGRVVIADRDEVLDGFALVARIDKAGITAVQATPSLWRLLVDAGFRSRPGLTMICGGEPLPRDLADTLMAGGGQLWNAYGPTETTIWSSLAHVGAGPITIGEPVLNTTFHVLDGRDRPTAVGVEGELFIGGMGLARGYFGRQDLTAAVFRTMALPGLAPQRLYKTGDRARRLADGTIQLIGRADNQVKLRGFRIELEEIESVLRQCPGVGGAAVAVREFPGEDRRLVAFLVPVPGVPLADEAAVSFAVARLPDYMVPRTLVRLDALPLTPNGKLDRRQLSAVAIDTAAAEPKRLPATPMQVRLADIVRDVLHLKEIGRDDNLFTLGADSLQLFRIAARMRNAAIALDVRDLMLLPTLEALAEKAEAAEAAHPVDPMAPSAVPSLRAFRRSNLKVAGHAP